MSRRVARRSPFLSRAFHATPCLAIRKRGDRLSRLRRAHLKSGSETQDQEHCAGCQSRTYIEYRREHLSQVRTSRPGVWTWENRVPTRGGVLRLKKLAVPRAEIGQCHPDGILPQKAFRACVSCGGVAPPVGSAHAVRGATPPHETQARNAFWGRMPSGWHCPISALGTASFFSRSTPPRVGTRFSHVQTPGRLVRTCDRCSRRYSI